MECWHARWTGGLCFLMKNMNFQQAGSCSFVNLVFLSWVPMLYTRQCNMFWAIVSLTAKVCYWIVNVFNFSDFLSISQYLDQCSSTFLSSWNPWYTFAFFVEPPSTKIKKTWITCQKIKYFVVKHSTNQHLLKILKSKKFNDSIDCSCISGMYLLHSEFGKKKNMLFCFIWLD